MSGVDIVKLQQPNSSTCPPTQPKHGVKLCHDVPTVLMCAWLEYASRGQSHASQVPTTALSRLSSSSKPGVGYSSLSSRATPPPFIDDLLRRAGFLLADKEVGEGRVIFGVQ